MPTNIGDFNPGANDAAQSSDDVRSGKIAPGVASPQVLPGVAATTDTYSLSTQTGPHRHSHANHDFYYTSESVSPDPQSSQDGTQAGGRTLQQHDDLIAYFATQGINIDRNHPGMQPAADIPPPNVFNTGAFGR